MSEQPPTPPRRDNLPARVWAATQENALILPIYVPTLLLAFCRGLIVPVRPLYAATFATSYSWVGLVLAAEGLGTLLGDLPAGVLFGRLGQRRSMLVGLSTLALSTLAMSWARSIWELMLYGFVAGLGTAIWNISRHAYLTDMTPSHRRGRAIAVFGGINRIGTFAGPVIGGTLGAIYGLRVPFVVYGLLGLAALIFPALFAKETVSARHVQRGGMRGHTGHLWQVVRENLGTLTPAGAGQLLGQMIRAGRDVVIPLFAAGVLGLEVNEIGLIVSLASAVDMSMFIPAGIIMDRLGRKFAYVPCFLIQGIAMALVPWTVGFWSLLAATVVIGFGNGLGSGTMMTLGADLAPPDSMGEFLGVWRLIGDTGQTGAPIVVGGVADLVGLATAPLVLGGVGILAATIFAFFVPETLKRPELHQQALN